MIINKGAFFAFKGLTSYEMGLKLLSAPTRAFPQPRGKSINDIAGKNGYIWQGDNAFEPYQVRIEVATVDHADIDKILYWLSGAGELVFSDELDRAYEARIITSFTRTALSPRAVNQRFTLTWQVQPYRLLNPPASDITITQSGTALKCIGTMHSEPRVTVIGDGDFMLTIGMQSIMCFNIDGGIVIDTQLGDALTLDGAGLLNHRISGELFKIDPMKLNVVSWLIDTDEETSQPLGNVQSVIIKPRWRFL